MLGDNATKLMQEAKRTISLEKLPPYNKDVVNAVCREIRVLDAQTSDVFTDLAARNTDPATDRTAACALFVLRLSLLRNKRCLLAYQRLRATRIEDLAWAGLEPSDTLAEGLAGEEDEYLRHYSDVIAEYKGSWTNVDLGGSLEPPNDLFIDVRVVQDAGDVQTEYGVLTLTKNSQFYVRQSDVERLIQQGILQRI
ncbi:hypothetical protein CANCADRAFT_32909 [Tortispora caseinolytica NRRL Y-17796]|uniref:DNA replication complex GINS protein PSF1 n=1 Tax=Tortispora caseinolytica NRRL Y-17796 TaxID=767744 RepID=A0A1E4TD99_9ASCO|nr:hypothetical protein CANCADRAFT_32909 [Tortispora caseinolytica NRRL Y-17796]